MPSGLEGLKGLAEKLPSAVRFPVVMRVVLPGTLAILVMYPFTGLQVDLVHRGLKDNLPDLILAGILAAVLGLLIQVLSGEIYKIYEGRNWWPEWLFNFLKDKQQSRIASLLKEAEELKASGQTFRYDEIWYRLRMCPVDEAGDPYASHPTLLGNILAEYEDYPDSRYGMDSVFYWPRLWLQLDKDKKEEIDDAWSVADGLLHVSATSYFGGILWILVSVVSWIVDLLPLNLSVQPVSAISGGLLLLLGFTLYRLSLPFHRKNGELFKALFDLYRDQLGVMTTLGPDEIEKWKATWAYLQYLRVYCGNCKKYFSVKLEKCPLCEVTTEKALEALKRLPCKQEAVNPPQPGAGQARLSESATQPSAPQTGKSPDQIEPGKN